MLFQNYGLFWHSDRIEWGYPGNAGTLLGKQLAKEDPIDFRYQRGVYALYDENFNMLYVGQAGYGNKRLYDRLDNHMSDHLAERWQRFSWFGIDRVVGKSGKRKLKESEPKAPTVGAVLNHLEAILIAAAEPALNRQGGKFGEAEQFFQFCNNNEDSDLIDAVDALSEKISAIERRLKTV